VGKANRLFYWITLNADLSEQKAQEIQKMHMIVFVLPEVKNKHPDKPWVRSLEELPDNLRSKI
jgi:hypothetical protein